MLRLLRGLLTTASRGRQPRPNESFAKTTDSGIGPVAPITRKTLWVLYCAIRLTRDQISHITGWGIAAIDRARYEWQMNRREVDERPMATRYLLLRLIRHLDLLDDYFELHRVDQLAYLRHRLSYALEHRRISIEQLDVLPTLDEVAAEHGIDPEEEIEAQRASCGSETAGMAT